MRGRRDPQPSLLSAIAMEDRARPDHPLRPIKAAADRVLAVWPATAVGRRRGGPVD
jgi:hypothetical protein